MERDIEAKPPRYAWLRTLAPLLIGLIAFMVLHREGRDLAAVLLLTASLAVALMLRKR